MTAAQKRASNRRNALKSTGPKTPEGKERARQNALKHGMCADELVLTIEKADALQTEFDDWIDHYQPVGPAEFAMVEDIAKSHLKLRRCTRRETAVVDMQVRSAYRDWEHAQEDRVVALKTLLATDPATAVRELSRFGAGRRWMIDRWKCLGQWFLRDGFCAVPALVDEAVRLLGADPNDLRAGPPVAYLFRLCCAVGRPDPDPQFIAWMLSDDAIHPEYHAEYGRKAPEWDGCHHQVRVLVAEQITFWDQEEKDWLSEENAEIAGVCLRAQIPADNGGTKLALRYESMARSALHKARKELHRLQDERYAAEAEADEPVPSSAQNEPDTPPGPPSTPNSVASCNACEDTNPEVPESGGMPTSSWACEGPQDTPTQTWACHPPDVTVITLEGPESPPA